MSGDYGSHANFMEDVAPDSERRFETVETELRSAFAGFIQREQLEVICLSEVSALQLAEILRKSPIILKPLLLSCSIAARAIERDIGIKSVNTYEPTLSPEQAQAIAGYMKPFLPAVIALRSLCELDRAAFVDKEIRKRKGRWEKRVLDALVELSGRSFRKRKFTVAGQSFELDAAWPQEGAIEIGVDVKRIEARRDIHKRCDEIVNKAQKLKSARPNARFAAVIYYPFVEEPFVEEHANVSDRLRSEAISSIVFAGEGKQSIRNAVKMLLDKVLSE